MRNNNGGSETTVCVWTGSYETYLCKIDGKLYYCQTDTSQGTNGCVPYNKITSKPKVNGTTGGTLKAK